MKRLHLHVPVGDIAQSVRFHGTLFTTEARVTDSAHARRMPDDPRLDVAISTCGGEAGPDHLGIHSASRACCILHATQGASCKPDPELVAYAPRGGQGAAS